MGHTKVTCSRGPRGPVARKEQVWDLSQGASPKACRCYATTQCGNWRGCCPPARGMTASWNANSASSALWGRGTDNPASPCGGLHLKQGFVVFFLLGRREGAVLCCKKTKKTKHTLEKQEHWDALKNCHGAQHLRPEPVQAGGLRPEQHSLYS